MQTPHYSVKWTGFSVPLVLHGLYKIHGTVAGMSLTQDCQALLIDSTTGHYNSIGMHGTSLWLAFFASVQQGKALERAFVVLNSTSMCCHTYRIYTGSL